ncbi:hypothetical protein HJC23_003187 [Cyclotella cryptica]|uniref:HSF-type DNA-binding domain-containing protein n=1 Tax=Cyclotella cryptica TaxID=29204 RepID=A0ABD3PNA9_9STRA|eukprot:CCRYP_012843-RA/>CCRYP_012843-RA protein AED:0.11 eAED:0.40 QI:0/0.5/0/1/1/1/3/0/442
MQPPVQDDDVSFATDHPPPPSPFPRGHGDTGSEIVVPIRQFAPPRRTDHTYQDYANQIPSPHHCLVTKKSGSNFPAKLHRMISDPANSEAIAWQSHGRAWKILDKRLLVDVVIPKYFLQTKYESFTRQLSGWGFKRLYRTGPDYHCYYHECFLRGLPHLTRLMKRVEPHQGKLLPNVEAEPNFAEMPIPLSTEYAQPQLPVTYQAGMLETVTHSFPHVEHRPNWGSHNGPPDTRPNAYGNYHYYDHDPPGPPSYPPTQPYHDIYSHPYQRSRPEQPFLHQSRPLPHDREHFVPTYHGENSAWAAAAMPPLQSYPAYVQAQHSYHTSPSIRPHEAAHQHSLASSYDSYSNWQQQQQSSIVNAPHYHYIHAEAAHQRSNSGYYSVYSTNPSGIESHPIVHQHSSPNNHDLYGNWYHHQQLPYQNSAHNGNNHRQSPDHRPYQSY